MFKLLYLKLTAHPQLGNVEFPIVEHEETSEIKSPYTTVIIGANGTGKSYILRTIAEIFRQTENHKNNNSKSLNLPFSFHLSYQLNQVTFDIIMSDNLNFDKQKKRRHFIFLKNCPRKIFFHDQRNWVERALEFEIELSELEFPNKLIVSSIMLNDRFTFAENTPEDFYQYLGVRRTRSITSTQTFTRKTVRYLFDATRSDTFREDLSDMLDFMGFERFFKIHYNTKYSRIFFSGDLQIDEFHRFFNEWWNYTNRKETNQPWGLWYYKKLLRENRIRPEQIVGYLNYLVNDSSRLHRKPRSRSKLFELDLFIKSSNNADDFIDKEYDLIEDLIKLDILSLEGIKIKKKKNEFSIEQSSSGEYHLLISLLGLYSKVEKSSLILIDEPEISLHPNWQMRYMSFLKEMFRKYADCHFIFTTHSHFLVSDLEGKSSSVLSITRDDKTNSLLAELLKGQDTYGWSAEEILYRVFKVKTTRNFYLESDLRELLHKIANNSNERARMKIILEQLKSLNISPNDPMNLIIRKADEYLAK